MIKAGEVKSVIFVDIDENLIFMVTLIRDDTDEHFPNVICEVIKTYGTLDNFDYVFKAHSNINDSDIKQDGKYCIIYKKFDDTFSVFVNASKRLADIKLKALKFYGGKSVLNHTAVYNMSDSLEIPYLYDIYDEEIKKTKRLTMKIS